MECGCPSECVYRWADVVDYRSEVAGRRVEEFEGVSRYRIVAKGTAVVDGDDLRFRPEDNSEATWTVGTMVLLMKPDGEIIESADYEGPALMAVEMTDEEYMAVDGSREYVTERLEDGRLLVTREKVQ